MATHAGARFELHEPERLRRSCVHDLPDVDPEPVAELRQLIHQGDVHRPEDVLEQLGELGRLGAGEPDHPVAHELVDLGCLCRALGVDATDQLRSGPDREIGPAGIDPLRGEGEMEVGTGLQSRGLERGRQHLPGRARVGGRLEDHGLALDQHLGQCASCLLEEGEIRLAGSRQRGRHADDQGVAPGEVGVVGRSSEEVRDAGDGGIRNVLDIAGAGSEHLDLGRVEVEPDHFRSGLGKGDGQGQADVAQPDHSDPCRTLRASGFTSRSIFHRGQSRPRDGDLPNRTGIGRYRSPSRNPASNGSCSAVGSEDDGERTGNRSRRSI